MPKKKYLDPVVIWSYVFDHICITDQPVGVNEPCLVNSLHSRCADTQSSCVDDGTLSNSYRCKCLEGTVARETVGDSTAISCGRILFYQCLNQVAYLAEL